LIDFADFRKEFPLEDESSETADNLEPLELPFPAPSAGANPA
jgi:hypothetical protein